MKALLCHNYYQQAGGEDEVFASEAALLEEHGHRVVRYTKHNDAIERMGRPELACKTLWNRETYRELRTLIRRERPDVMHCTNTFPLISPAAYYAARAEGVPVVQSLHNYRLLCPNAMFLRDGRVCEDCLGKNVPWPGVRHACYRGNRSASAVVATLLAGHRLLGTWVRAVTLYIALTEFAREKFIAGGFAAKKIVVKPNFIAPDPGTGAGQGGYALFVGRLAPEKGIDTLLSAWSCLPGGPPLKIVGDGPLADRVRAAAGTGVEWLGRRSMPEVLTLLGEAAFLVLPSIWYEGLPRTIVEAFAKGTPVVASRLGAMSTAIEDGRTGLHFEPGNADDLASKARQLWTDTAARTRMREEARRDFENKYTAARNYEMLLAIYAQACGGLR